MKLRWSHQRQISDKAWEMTRTTVGTALCVGLAGLMTAVFSGNGHAHMLPIIFIGVLLALSFRFGGKAGVLGSVGAALIFSYFLFAPVRSFHVMNEAARSSLTWMLLVGIPASYLLAPASKK